MILLSYYITCIMSSESDRKFFVVGELYIWVMLCLFCKRSDAIDDVYRMEKALTDECGCEGIVFFFSSVCHISYEIE